MAVTRRVVRRVVGRLSPRMRICLLLLAAYAVWLHLLLSLAGALGASLASGG